MKASTIITAVRNRLGDSDEERWDEDTLLLYVSLCQNDICMFTRFYRKEASIQLVNNQYIYDLPTDCLLVNRLEYHDKLLPIETRNNIDSDDVTYPLVLKDNLPFNKIEFRIGEQYTDLSQALINVYGVTVNSSTNAVDTSLYPLQDANGVVVDVDKPKYPVSKQDLDKLKVYYSATPPVLMDVDEDLIVPDIWFQAFIHFVCAMALQDDNDANNIQRGELEATKYVRVLENIHKISSKDFTGNVRTKLTTNVRRI